MDAAAVNRTPCPPCPRCDSPDTRTAAHSPVADCWTVLTCGTCHFCWRSTEPWLTGQGWHPAFRLDPATFAEVPVLPPVPPLRAGG